MLAHGIPVANDDLVPAPTEDLDVPVVRAPDGYGLAAQVRGIWSGGVPDRTLARRSSASTFASFDDPPEYLVDEPDER